MLCLGQEFKRGEDGIDIHDITTTPLRDFLGIRKDLLRHRAHSATSYHQNLFRQHTSSTFGNKLSPKPLQATYIEHTRKQAIENNTTGNMHQAFSNKATSYPFETAIGRKPQKRAPKRPKGKAGGVGSTLLLLLFKSENQKFALFQSETI